MARSRFRATASACTFGLFVAWLVGQVFRDRYWVTALCFYLPSPLVAALLAALALSSLRGRRRTAGAAALLAAVPLAFVVGVENRWSAPADAGPGGRLRLVHWNVFGGAWGWAGVREELRAQRADAYVLAEVPGGASMDDLAAELGDDFVAARRGSLAVLARGRLTVADAAIPGVPRSLAVDWEVDGARLSVLVVDLPSNPAVERAPLLAAVREAVAESRPDLVVGDFNAPRRSRSLADLPSGYAHAYDLAGSGWSYTWPVPVPLWAIDQCVVGPRIEALRYELHSTGASDHRLQVLAFRPPTVVSSRRPRSPFGGEPWSVVPASCSLP